jgi:hypothetical protein
MFTRAQLVTDANMFSFQQELDIVLEEIQRKEIDILDIKFSSDNDGYHALIIYIEKKGT